MQKWHYLHFVVPIYLSFYVESFITKAKIWNDFANPNHSHPFILSILYSCFFFFCSRTTKVCLYAPYSPLPLCSSTYLSFPVTAYRFRHFYPPTTLYIIFDQTMAPFSSFLPSLDLWQEAEFSGERLTIQQIFSCDFLTFYRTRTKAIRGRHTGTNEFTWETEA